MAGIVARKLLSEVLEHTLKIVKKPRTAEKMLDVAEHFFSKGTQSGIAKGNAVLQKAAKLFPDNPKVLAKYSDEITSITSLTQTNAGKIPYPDLHLTKNGINLARNPKFVCDIPYNSEHYYRAIGKSGYEDFIETGVFRAKQGTKYGYQKIYFEKGYVNSIYARKGGGEYILETNSTRIKTPETGYPQVEFLNPATDKIRIWHRLAEDKNGQPSYEIIYDTMTGYRIKN